MSIWFQDDNGNWSADKPAVVGYAVLHHSLNDDDKLYTKAEADEIAAGLDGAVVYGVVDVTTGPAADAEGDRRAREMHDANKSEVDRNELAIAKGLGEHLRQGLTLTEAITELEERQAVEDTYVGMSRGNRAKELSPANVNNQPPADVSWGPDGDRRAWDETSRSWVTDPDWDGVRFDDDLAETSHAVARAREALAELDSSRQDRAEEDRGRWLADDTSREVSRQGATDVR